LTAAVPVRLGQYPVESRGAAAPLDVPQHRDARLYPSVGFVDVFVNSLAESGASSAAYDEVWLALFPASLKSPHDLFRLWLELRDQHSLSPARYGAHERQVPAAATHHSTTVARWWELGGILYPVYDVECGVQCRVQCSLRSLCPCPTRRCLW